MRNLTTKNINLKSVAERRPYFLNFVWFTLIGIPHLEFIVNQLIRLLNYLLMPAVKQTD